MCYRRTVVISNKYLNPASFLKSLTSCVDIMPTAAHFVRVLKSMHDEDLMLNIVGEFIESLGGEDQHRFLQTLEQQRHPDDWLVVRRSGKKLEGLYKLSDKLLLKVFSFLSIPSDLLRIAAVCRHFYQLAHDETLWRTVDLRHLLLLSDESLKNIIVQHPHTRHLRLSWFNKTTDNCLAMLKHELLGLRDLDISSCEQFSAEAIADLLSKSNLNLETAQLSYCDVTDQCLEALADSSPHLRTLNLAGCTRISNVGLARVCKKCPDLESLNVSFCEKLTEEGFSYVGQLDRLRYLYASSVTPLNDRCLRSISRLAELEVLDVNDCRNVSNVGMQFLAAGCPRLKSIKITLCHGITEQGREFLEQRVGRMAVAIKGST